MRKSFPFQYSPLFKHILILFIILTSLVYFPQKHLQAVTPASEHVHVQISTQYKSMEVSLFTAFKSKGLSTSHHIKFFSMKPKLGKINESRLFPLAVGPYAGIVLSTDIAYLHIWKNGGTTIESQTSNEQLHIYDQDLQTRDLLTFVRDPIERFLSAWAECGTRWQLEVQNEWERDLDYNSRIQSWLSMLKAHPDHFQDWNSMSKAEACGRHGAPQFNFLLSPAREIHPNLKLIADLRDMKVTLNLLEGFFYNASKEIGRKADANNFKQQHYPRDRSQLSKETLLKICDWVIYDYCFFDFAPPEVCLDVVTATCGELRR